MSINVTVDYVIVIKKIMYIEYAYYYSNVCILNETCYEIIVLLTKFIYCASLSFITTLLTINIMSYVCTQSSITLIVYMYPPVHNNINKGISMTLGTYHRYDSTFKTIILVYFCTSAIRVIESK